MHKTVQNLLNIETQIKSNELNNWFDNILDVN